MILALGLLLTLPIVTGWSVAHAAEPVGQFGNEPRSGLVVTLLGDAAHEPLMPGGTYREVFAITTAVDSVYNLALSLSSNGQSLGRVHVAMQDALGHGLYDGPSARAEFKGRYLAAHQTDLITVSVNAPADGADLPPGTIVLQTWTATAQPT